MPKVIYTNSNFLNFSKILPSDYYRLAQVLEYQKLVNKKNEKIEKPKILFQKLEIQKIENPILTSTPITIPITIKKVATTEITNLTTNTVSFLPKNNIISASRIVKIGKLF